MAIPNLQTQIGMANPEYLSYSIKKFIDSSHCKQNFYKVVKDLYHLSIFMHFLCRKTQFSHE